MTSTGQPKVPSACCSERVGTARIPRRAHVVARATPAGDGDTWGKPRDPIEDAKQFVYSSTERVRSRLTQSADDLGSKAAEAAREMDRKYNVRVKFRHAQTDFQRMLPHWKRRFRQFASSQVGKTTFTLLLLWSIVSGTLFRAVQIFLLLWWILPLLVIPLLRKNAAKVQENMYGAASPGGSRGFGNAQGPKSGREFRRPGGFPRPRRQGPDPQEGQVIDVEWTAIDSDTIPGRKR